ncbi:MAG: DoxX family membrane protein [Pseudonocardiaceae bacterium]
MLLLRRVARPLLAAIFVSGGVDDLLNPDPKLKAAAALLDKSPQALPNAEPATLVQVDAAVKVGAGLLLALGRVPRLAAAALAASLIPSTVVGHPFWEVSDKTEQAAQRIHFLKNAGLLGGLLLAMVDSRGKPPRARRTARKAKRKAKQVSKRSR